VSIAALLGSSVAFSADRGLRSVAIPPVVSAVEAAHRGAPIPDHLIPPIATIKLYPRRYTVSRGCLSHNRSNVVPARICRVGEASSKKLIVLLGDSHAFMWLPPTLVMARRDGWSVVPLLRFGCTPDKWFSHRGPNGPVCRRWLRWAIGEAHQLHPTVVLLGGSVGEAPSPQTTAAVTGMITAARTLKPLGRVVVVGDPEGLGSNPVQCVTTPQATMASCMTTWPDSALAAYDAVARGTMSSGVGFLPTRGFVCSDRQCPAVVGHTIAWIDTNHLTGIYSAQLSPWFRAAFLKLVQK
jgi:hypothetical protein